MFRHTLCLHSQEDLPLCQEMERLLSIYHTLAQYLPAQRGPGSSLFYVCAKMDLLRCVSYSYQFIALLRRERKLLRYCYLPIALLRPNTRDFSKAPTRGKGHKITKLLS